MEIASDELITEAEKERTRKILDQFCVEACSALSADEAKITARAVFHDAVAAAAKSVAEGICAESVPIAKDIVEGMLKDSAKHPYVEGAVIEAVQPVARSGAYAAIRRWSEEQALPKAEESARKVIAEKMDGGCQPVLHTAVLAGIRVILENQLGSNPQLSLAEREKLMDDYLAGEAKRAAIDIVAKGFTAELRRKAQRAAELAVEEVAAKATDGLARDEALDAARVVAIDTAKLEISRLVLAEAQRRAAKLARERLQEEAAAQDEDKRIEYCQEAAKKIAEEAVNSVTEEIADPSVADLDLEKARELALSAASAVAREFSGAYQMTPDDESTQVSTRTLIFLAVQIFIGCFIVWFFLLGGYETCEPLLKAILPPSVYRSIYIAVPHRAPSSTSKTGVEVDDLLDEQKPAGSGNGSGTSTGSGADTGSGTSNGAEDDVPRVRPESSLPDEPGTLPTTPKVSQPAIQPGSQSGPQPAAPAGLHAPSRSGSQSATPAGSQPATPSGSQPATPSGSQPSESSPGSGPGSKAH